jgi:hypothetical protein
MEAKLIKIEDGKYDLLVDTNLEALKDTKLSLKNCQAIELGYDLDELAEKEFPYDFDCPLFKTLGINEKSHKSILIGMLQGTLQKGFQKALELLGDKKFSEKDVEKAIELSRETELKIGGYDPRPFTSTKHSKKEIIQSLQQKEWLVEIEMEIVDEKLSIGATCIADSDFISVTKRPKLDAEGCLILKRRA